MILLAQYPSLNSDWSYFLYINNAKNEKVVESGDVQGSCFDASTQHFEEGQDLGSVGIFSPLSAKKRLPP